MHLQNVRSCHFSPFLHSQKIQEWGWLAKADVPVHPGKTEGCYTSSVTTLKPRKANKNLKKIVVKHLFSQGKKKLK